MESLPVDVDVTVWQAEASKWMWQRLGMGWDGMGWAGMGWDVGSRDSLPVTFHVDANYSMRSLRRHMTLKAYTL